MHKIVILDGYTIHPTPEELKIFSDFGEVMLYHRTPAHLTISRIGNATVVFTDSTYIGKAVLDACPNIKYIGILATGLNSVDINYAKSKNITVCNVPAYGTDSVSQYAFSLLLYGASKMEKHNAYVTEGHWTQNAEPVPYWDFSFLQLAGKTMGIIGFGNIGKRSVKTALSLGMKVLVYTKYPDDTFATNFSEPGQLIFSDMDTLLSSSHVIMLHCPLIEQSTQTATRNVGLINGHTIDQMKDGVILINTARGKLIVETDLADALNRGKISFAGLDVLAEEPANPNNPLLSAKNCFITPHAAWTSEDARKKIIQISLENLRRFIAQDR